MHIDFYLRKKDFLDAAAEWRAVVEATSALTTIAITRVEHVGLKGDGGARVWWICACLWFVGKAGCQCRVQTEALVWLDGWIDSDGDNNSRGNA